jgi:hypothetical protein
MTATPLTPRLDSFAPPAGTKIPRPLAPQNSFARKSSDPRAAPTHFEHPAYENRAESVELQPKIALSPTPNSHISAHSALPTRSESPAAA